MSESLLQFIKILQLPLFPSSRHTKSLGRMILPDSNVGVVTPTENELGVGRVSDGEHVLHALGVVAIATFRLVVGKDAHCCVVPSRHELTTSW